jgi:hypothetical protein
MPSSNTLLLNLILLIEVTFSTPTPVYNNYRKTEPLAKLFPTGSYCSFAYSALASFRMGMSGSASFQRAKNS